MLLRVITRSHGLCLSVSLCGAAGFCLLRVAWRCSLALLVSGACLVVLFCLWLLFASVMGLTVVRVFACACLLVVDVVIVVRGCW